jgi:hypothetical protein
MSPTLRYPLSAVNHVCQSLERRTFLDRDAELGFLCCIQTGTHPGPGPFISLYGRRRVRKIRPLPSRALRTFLPGGAPKSAPRACALVGGVPT